MFKQKSFNFFLVIWVKLTQGTGRGTCGWINFLKMSEILQKLDFFNFYLNWNFEDVIVVFLLYNFFKYLIICSITELIWPTQFFNRKNNIGYQIFRFRTFTEVILKLRNYSSYYFVFNLFLFKNVFINK